jgi:nucleoside-diphosphate-sugar epimerase
MMSLVCKTYGVMHRIKALSVFLNLIRWTIKNGEQRRDFVYVKDVVEVMYYFLANSQKNRHL